MYVCMYVYMYVWCMYVCMYSSPHSGNFSSGFPSASHQSIYSSCDWVPGFHWGANSKLFLMKQQWCGDFRCPHLAMRKGLFSCRFQLACTSHSACLVYRHLSSVRCMWLHSKRICIFVYVMYRCMMYNICTCVHRGVGTGQASPTNFTNRKVGKYRQWGILSAKYCLFKWESNRNLRSGTHSSEQK